MGNDQGYKGYNLDEAEKNRILSAFQMPDYQSRPVDEAAISARKAQDPAFARWMRVNVHPHKNPERAVIDITVKGTDRMPGDNTADEMDKLADLTERYSMDEIRVTFVQNLVMPHVARADIIALYDELVAMGLTQGLQEMASDIICCPGLDYCNLANARSLPIAEKVTERFKDPALREAIGSLRINMSGCINACGHHHSGHIGILGVDKKGVEAYQITLGGSTSNEASIGQIIGPAVSGEEVPDAIETLVKAYMDIRDEDETFLQTWRRVGKEPFKEALYGVA
jgi:sulfite reductase (NADPH) hemoprotein beta-component